MNTEHFKMTVPNRGWISSNFFVRNPVSHLLSIYKKKNLHNKNQEHKEFAPKFR